MHSYFAEWVNQGSFVSRTAAGGSDTIEKTARVSREAYRLPTNNLP